MKAELILFETYRNKDEHYVDITKCALSILEEKNPYLVFNERHLSGEKPELKKFQIKKVRFFDSPVLRILQLLYYQIRFTKSHKIYLSTYPIFNLFTIIWSVIDDGKTYLFIHGELSVFSNRNLKIREKINKMIQSNVYRYVNKTNNVFICFLDSAISKGIVEKINITNPKNLIGLNWPIEQIRIPKERNKDKIEIGLFGTHNLKKQSNLINYLESNLKNKQFLFKVVGHNDDILFNENIHKILPKEPNYHVDHSTYLKELGKCDFILSFSKYDEYEFIWSGTVITAMKYAVPILTLKNRTFNHYSYLYENFGIEFETVDHMLDYLNKNSIEYLRNVSTHYEQNLIKKNYSELMNKVLQSLI